MRSKPLPPRPDRSTVSDIASPEENRVHRKLSESVVVPQHCYQNRRRKAAVVLTVVWGGTITLHLVSWGFWVTLGLSGLLSIPILSLVLQRSYGCFAQSKDNPLPQLPFVSLLVAAKNEEAVIEDLVKNLCQIDYPNDSYELWVIDDNSTDQTAQVLDRLAQEYPQLNVLQREGAARGGKSGALNQVLPLTRGEIVGVFDADAQVPQDLLQQVIPLFSPGHIGAVQMRKAIANSSLNFWTRGQATEMVFDAFIQDYRIASGGLGELRGNGQFVRRIALNHCDGWNEETITDDLDLTFRLHLNRWDIEILMFPPVQEEGVTQLRSLWHQRNRWAEGGYQRYLDYWQPLVRNRMGTRKSLDALGFLIFQYLLPTAALPDYLMALILRRPPLTLPLTCVTVLFSFLGIFLSLRRTLQQARVESKEADSLAPIPSILTLWLQSLRGTLYMLHWFIVIGSTTLRMSVRPKRLKWVKTIHQGNFSQP
ncbi:MAG: glycosyltransferase [Microcoleaceae cyanobacterium]